MKSIPLSLRSHLDNLVLEDSRVINQMTFPTYNDFQNLGKYYGERPLVFSFENIFQSRDGWMELMDGHVFLVHHLYSTQEIRPFLILPQIAKKILPKKFKAFNYSSYSYQDKLESCRDKIYVYMNYFENLTSLSFLEETFKKVHGLCSQYSEVNLVTDFFLGASGEDSNPGKLFNGLRMLPKNCKILASSEFLSIKNLNRAQVIFFYDQDILTHSVFEELAILKNGLVVSEKISKQDKLIKEFDIYPRVKRQIHSFDVENPALTARQEKELFQVVKLISKPSELLNDNFRRLIRDIINSEGEVL